MAAETFKTVPLYRGGTPSTFSKRLVVRELRDGGLPEIAGCSENAVFMYTKSGAGYVQSWAAPAACRAMDVGDMDGDGRAEIVTGGVGGILALYDPASLGAPRKAILPGTPTITALAVGNVDNDPQPEIVAVTSANTYVYDGVSLALEWTATGRTGTSVAIAEIDGDSKNEILLTGTDGTVLDGYTQTFKWGYVGGFGSPFTTADVDGDGKAEIIGYFSGAGQIRTLNGDTFTTSSFTGSADAAITVGDANNDGTSEIVGLSYYGNHGYDKTTGTVVWTNYVYSSGLNAAVADPDGDGLNELVASYGDGVRVTNVVSNTVEASIGLTGSSYRVAAGDIDGDGRVEVITALYKTDATEVLEVRDGTTGALRGQVPVPANTRIDHIALGQVDNDAAREIVVLAVKNYDVYLMTFDGVTYANEYTSPVPAYNSAILDTQLAIANLDGDAVEEIVLARSDARFEVLNGASNVIQYVSEPLGGTTGDFALADTDGDSVQDLVVGTDAGLYVIKTSDWSQRLHATVSYPGASRVAATNGEILYASGYTSNNVTTVVALAGDTLAERWRCTSSFPGYPNEMRYAMLNGVERAIVATTTGLRIVEKNGNACPTPVTVNTAAMDQAIVTDVTGDGRPDLLGAYGQVWEVAAITSDTFPRGDVDGDGQVTDADLDALALYFYNGAAGAPATADVNGDGCIQADDLFYLINYRRGTGAAPPQ